MNAVQLSSRAAARPSARRELLQALLEWAAVARREPGVRAVNVHEDVETPATFGLAGEWESWAALETHLRSRSFGVLLGALELLAEPPGLTLTRAIGEEWTDALPAIRRLREAGGADR